ncbi:MAG: sensor domain-containing diguanylate cyclase [Gammaproteobacteria bacterium]|nr:sensor domain-containing diguanylate cyclase [Gammaproteobacteria bacterium]
MPAETGIYQLMHVVLVLLPALLWFLVQRVQLYFIHLVVVPLAFVFVFSAWSYQLVISSYAGQLLTMAGILLLLVWHYVYFSRAIWLSIPLSLSLLLVVKLFSTTEINVLLVYLLLMAIANVLGGFSLTGRASGALQLAREPEQSIEELEQYFDDVETDVVSQVPVKAEAVEYVPATDADIAQIQMNASHATLDWEQILRELHGELKNIHNVDNLFKSMLTFMSGVFEFDAAVVAMIQDKTINKVVSTGPDDLVSSKVLGWDSKRLKELFRSSHPVVSQQDHLSGRGELDLIYRVDVPIMSNNSPLGLVTIIRRSSLFDESDVKLASAIVFHSMIALNHARLVEEVKRLSGTSTRSKTLYSREQFIEKANEQLALLNKPKPFSLMVVEIDSMENIYTQYGQELANQLYKTMATSIMSNLRSDDFMGRYGKDGFIILLHDAELLQAKEMAEKIRLNVSKAQCKTQDGVFSSTLSIGLTSVSEQGDDMQSLVRKADMGLFVAKESGRNSVKVSL